MKVYRFNRGRIGTQHVEMPYGGYVQGFDENAVRPVDGVSLDEELEIVLVYGKNGRVVEVLVALPDDAQPLDESEAQHALAPASGGNGHSQQ